MELTYISLFAGIGGIDLAAMWAGFKALLFCEKDNYCQKVLKKHWPDVPIIGDIKDVTRKAIEEIIANTTQLQKYASDNQRDKGAPQIHESGNGCRSRYIPTRRTKVKDTRPITLISGGFPCQPVSVAGKRKGKADDRWLWPEMLRVVSEIRPTWVIGENVAGVRGMDITDSLLDLGCETADKESEAYSEILDGILTDLERIGYEVQSFLIPACGINAPHRRYRAFIVGYSTEQGLSNRRRTQVEEYGETKSESKRPNSESTRLQDATDSDINRKKRSESQNYERGRITQDDENVADTKCEPYRHSKCQGSEIFREKQTERHLSGWWAVEPDVGRVAYGIPSRVDRLKCLGNAVVPQQIYPILKYIAEIENE